MLCPPTTPAPCLLPPPSSPLRATLKHFVATLAFTSAPCMKMIVKLPFFPVCRHQRRHSDVAKRQTERQKDRQTKGETNIEMATRQLLTHSQHMANRCAHMCLRHDTDTNTNTSWDCRWANGRHSGTKRQGDNATMGHNGVALRGAWICYF